MKSYLYGALIIVSNILALVSYLVAIFLFYMALKTFIFEDGHKKYSLDYPYSCPTVPLSYLTNNTDYVYNCSIWCNTMDKWIGQCYDIGDYICFDGSYPSKTDYRIGTCGYGEDDSEKYTRRSENYMSVISIGFTCLVGVCVTGIIQYILTVFFYQKCSYHMQVDEPASPSLI